VDIAQTIKQRAQERGVDPELALAIAKAESGLRPQIKNPKSSAHGLFQIVDDTWKQYGGDPKKRKDVNENIRIGLEILADNQRALSSTLGRAPRPGELYAAHFFGKAGAQRVLTANPDAPISSVVSERVLKANPELLQGKSVYQALSALGAKVGDTGPGQRVPRAPDPKTARPVYREDPAKPPVISNAIDATNQYGPGYQAALALSYLSDTEEESDDPEAPTIVEREAKQEAEFDKQVQSLLTPTGPRASDMLAQMDFGYAPVVGQPQEPVRMADGGLLMKAASVVPVSAQARNKYESARRKWEAYANQGKAYDAALAKYNNEVMKPYMAQVEQYNRAVNEWNAGPRTSELTVAAPRPSREFTVAAPTAPKTLSGKQMEDLLAQAQKRRALTSQALTVAADPAQFNLSMPAMFNEGGEVTDPEAAMFAGRGDVPAKPNMTGRELAQQALYGVGDLPYVVAGAPVDLAAMAMAPFGYKDPKPFMGSADIKARMTRAGIRPADTTDPRLMGPRSAAELLSSLTNPAGVTRGAVTAAQKGAQAVGTGVMQGAQRAEKALEPVVTSTMERGGKAAEMLEALSPAPAQAMPGKVGAPAPAAKPAVFTQLPSAEAPFVGRLDKFAAEMPGPMKKEQLLGTLKGKFKDYEIERATRALEDLPADAKVMSTDFLNRLNNVYNPSGFRTTVIEPEGGSSFFRANDNILGAGEDTPPMGVIHLSKFVDVPTEEASQLAKGAGSDLYRLARGGSGFLGRETMPLDSVLQWADTQPDGFHIKNLLNSGPVMRAKEAVANGDRAYEAFETIVFPRWDSIPFPLKEDGRVDFLKYEELKEQAAKNIRQQGKDVWAKLGLELPPDPPGLDPFTPYSDPQYKQQMLDIVKGYQTEARKMAQNAIYPVMDDLADLRERIDAGGLYESQHQSLKAPPQPIAFSRFTEHTATIPGMGEVKGIWVRELQSDMLDDMRKVGKKGGSVDKDYQELKEVETKLRDRYDMPDSEVYRLLGREKVLKERLDKRHSSKAAPYSLDEVFAGMENSPQVMQQLMAKNAIQGAIQRGARFVAFPGKESDQAQLYEKLPRNLDAVVKDLGPGFTRTTVTLPIPDAEPAMFNAIAWSPEAAQKLQKSGIPFAKGGMVERNNHDNRSYK
jgi:hypothetical protein